MRPRPEGRGSSDAVLHCETGPDSEKMKKETKEKEGMKCRDMLDKLSEYIDGELDPRLCRDLERHAEGCHPCLLFIDSLKKTITFYKYAGHEPMPKEVHIRLHEYLKKKSSEDS